MKSTNNIKKLADKFEKNLNKIAQNYFISGTDKINLNLFIECINGNFGTKISKDIKNMFEDKNVKIKYINEIINNLLKSQSRSQTENNANILLDIVESIYKPLQNTIEAFKESKEEGQEFSEELSLFINKEFKNQYDLIKPLYDSLIRIKDKI